MEKNLSLHNLKVSDNVIKNSQNRLLWTLRDFLSAASLLLVMQFFIIAVCYVPTPHYKYIPTQIEDLLCSYNLQAATQELYP